MPNTNHTTPPAHSRLRPPRVPTTPAPEGMPLPGAGGALSRRLLLLGSTIVLGVVQPRDGGPAASCSGPADRGVLSPSEVAAMSFEPWPASAIAMPSAADYLQEARAWWPILRLAMGTMGRSKIELVAMFRAEPDATAACIEEMMKLHHLYLQRSTILETAAARLTVAGTVVDLERATA